ncbi:MAG: diacylglycerol kinase [Rhizobiaceae bacterium]
MRYLFNVLLRNYNALTVALNGIRLALRSEQMFREEFALAVLIPLALWGLGGDWQLLPIVVLTLLVLIAELFNTAIEKLCDFVEPGSSPAIGSIKDMACAGVFLSKMAYLAYVIQVLYDTYRS